MAFRGSRHLQGLREYQKDLVFGVEAAWRDGKRRPAIVLPTGMGKTHTFARIMMRWRDRQIEDGARETRAVLVAHRDELIQGAAGALRSALPADQRVGVVQAGANGTLAPYVVCSVQTLANERRRRQLLNVGLVVVDECHHAAAKSYRDVLKYFGCEKDSTSVGEALALGVTATMSRGDKLALGDVWQDVISGPSIAEGIDGGWLVRPRGVRVRINGLNLATVKRTGGDYQAGSLGEALENADAPHAIVRAVKEHADDRPTIIFAPLVHTADLIRDALREAGYTAETVSGKTPKETRKAILDRFRKRELQFLCNAMVFTEGTDLPLASCCVIARPTTNPALYIQMVGRVLRPSEGKTDALVLDVVGASQRHALNAHIELYGEEDAYSLQHDPCECGGAWGDGDCPCGQRKCSAECACGGGKPGECGCPRAVELDEGELTLDTALDADDESWRSGAPIVSEHVDLFHRSGATWLRTAAGVWFLSAGDWYIAILPGDPARGAGLLDVARVHVRERGQWRWVVRDVTSFADAMMRAEGDVTNEERTIAGRSKGWRDKGVSAKQMAAAARWGLQVSPLMTAGEVSNRIAVASATARIDVGLPAYVRGR